ncbi:MAG: hypothetical protein ACHP78_20100 [Terriglobales bacterium]
MSVGAAGAQQSSCEAEVFVIGSLEKKPAVASPDGRYRVVLVGQEDAEDGGLQVFRGGKLLSAFRLQDLSGGIFVKWAPDSRAFYFMWSNGGTIGGYSVRVFRVADDRVAEVLVTAHAERDFARRYYCKSRGNNVFAIQWLNGSGRLLIATQVYPTSDCGKDMGLYRGYEVRTDDGSILHRYSEKELRSVWPDGCPSRIWPTGLWGDAELQQAKQELKNKEQSH